MVNTARILVGIGIVAAFIILLLDADLSPRLSSPVTNPQYGEIKRTRLVSGVVVPETQVEIKPHVSGILEKFMVSVGDSIARGEPIASIRILPDPVSLEQAEWRVRVAKIKAAKETRSFQRNKNLFDNGVISESEFDVFSNSRLLAQEELISARNRREIIMEGSIANTGAFSNTVQSTMSGVVLELPVRRGSSVIMTNNFHEGTTIASIADLSSLSFIGHVHEWDVMYIKEGMRIPVTVPAWNHAELSGVISHVAPQGSVINGIRKFQFQVALETYNQPAVPSGIGGIAEIVLQSVSQVLVLGEKDLWWVDDSSFVDLFDPSMGQFRRQFIRTGLSDGVFIETVEGLSPKSQVRIRR